MANSISCTVSALSLVGLTLLIPLGCSKDSASDDDGGMAGASGTSGGGGAAALCVGVKPPASAYGATPGPVAGGGTSGSGGSPATDAGSTDGAVPDGGPSDAGGDSSAGAGGSTPSSGGANGGSGTGGGAFGGTGAGGSASTDDGCPTCVGSPAPSWQLEDFQPQSCGEGAVYGLSNFKGRVTVAALLAGW